MSKSDDSPLFRRWQFSGAKEGPHLLITGGVHGDEYEPIAALWQLIDALEQNAGGLALLRGTLTLIPVANEAAFALRQRTAEDGLDLARSCPGDSTGTITMQVAAELSREIRAADYYIDLHTGGTALSILPMTGYTLHRDEAVLARQRQMAHAFNLPIAWGTSPALQGRTLSVARDAGVPAIYAEHGGAGRCDPGGVNDYLAGCLNTMSWLGMITREQPASRVKQQIEDARPDSGHLQVCHRSPASGFFQPAGELGKRFEQGELFGTVTTLDRQTLQVDAEQSGVLLVLRTTPSVQEGETLGVILEMPAESP